VWKPTALTMTRKSMWEAAAAAAAARSMSQTDPNASFYFQMGGLLKCLEEKVSTELSAASCCCDISELHSNTPQNDIHQIKRAFS
jgi:hypothetical protein